MSTMVTWSLFLRSTNQALVPNVAPFICTRTQRHSSCMLEERNEFDAVAAVAAVVASTACLLSSTRYAAAGAVLDPRR